jgi:hypothetical protein
MIWNASLVVSRSPDDPSRAARIPKHFSSGKAPLWPDGLAVRNLTAGLLPFLGSIPLICTTTVILGGTSLHVESAGLSVVIDQRIVRHWNDLGCLKR